MHLGSHEGPPLAPSLFLHLKSAERICFDQQTSLCVKSQQGGGDLDMATEARREYGEISRCDWLDGLVRKLGRVPLEQLGC